MDAYSKYYIVSKHEENKTICFTDQNPTGVTISIKDQNDNGGQTR